MAGLRLAFLGTPDFAVPTLRQLLHASHKIEAVYTQPPKPAGRGQAPRRSPVHRFAEGRGLEVRTPCSLKDPEVREAFRSLGLDVAVVVAYGQILPRAILEAPRLGCLNVHASLLPRWRGAAPIHRAILEGDRETGVSIMLMDEGLDTGPVLLSRSTPIERHDTVSDLHDRLAHLGADMLVEALDGLGKGALTPSPQPENGVTYAKKIDKSEGRIDWSRPAAEIDRKVRGLTPFPGAFTDIKGERLKILAGEPVEGAGRPGEVIDQHFTVACGEGAYRIERAQREGRAPMDTPHLLRGFAIPPGSRLD